MNIDSRYFCFITVLLSMLLTACSDEVGTDPSTPAERPGLRLMIPASRFASAEPDAVAQELAYSSLFLFAFPDGDDEPKIIPLTVDDDGLNVIDTYRSYPLDLKPGNYRFALVANHFDPEADVTTLPQSEPELKEEILTYLEATFDGQIPDAGLPMAAEHSDFYVRDASGRKPMSTTASWKYDPDKAVTLYADMTFGCAKVTVDARDAAGEPAEVTDVKLHNLSKTAPVIYRSGHTYGALSAVEPDATGGLTFYIPERYVDAATPSEQSHLTMKVDGREVLLPLGEPEGASLTQSNPLPAEDSHRKIARSTHYKYNLTTVDRITLEVEDWIPELVSARLAGPVYLHVKEQVVEIKPGEVTRMWFDSDAREVYLRSPEYGKIDFYEYEIKGDSISIWVNDDIKSEEYEAIRAEESKYNYFHIVAGPIAKRITVYPFDLENYLNVRPTNAQIDVRETVSSGLYDGNITLTALTNYPNVKITLGDGWDDLPAGEWGAEVAADKRSLRIIAPDGSELTPGGEISASVENGSAAFTLRYQGLNSGYLTWTSQRTLNLTVTGYDGHSELSATLPVTIVPSIQDYIIHFKAPDWNNPHIYVYQCLEFPGDWSGMFGSTPLASRPVGYPDGSINNVPQYSAALEYCFSGKIAFKGWNHPVNSKELYDADGNVNTFTGSFAQGFYIFKDNQMSWKATEHSQPVRYYYDMDFSAVHRNEIASECPDCVNNPKELWPGIRMKKEENGWWKYTLTGIATPGKTLIMFADGHQGSTEFRFPGDKQVGVPLFDYPSREGWIFYNGKMDDRTNNIFTSAPTIYRIYYPKSGVNDKNYIHLWINKVGGLTDWGKSTSEVKETGKYYYFDFEAPTTDEMLNCIIYDNNNTNNKVDFSLNLHSSWKLSTFSSDKDGNNCATIASPAVNSSALLPGPPSDL